ncbi:MAG: hypothetical protein Kow0059_06600 [Candidatus Sumerlaeia bacterium]
MLMTSETQSLAQTTKVLIVDDNRAYREAFRRNLMLQNYEVCEAENAEQALQVLEKERPDVIVTDLAMRTEREGLQLIRSTKNLYPLMPLIMISAVGTFEEGAEASRLGASYVISKSSIDQELQTLYTCIDRASRRRKEGEALLEQLRAAAQTGQAPPAVEKKIRDILSSPEADPYLKAEVFEQWTRIEDPRQRERSTSEFQEIAQEAGGTTPAPSTAELAELVPGIGGADKDTISSLQMAEVFYQQHERGQSAVDLTRSIGFSFCFAVENECKVRLRRKFNKMLSSSQLYEVIEHLLDARTGGLDLFFHQYILRLQQSRQFAFTVDNVKQTLQRIQEHRDRYKPDGLKAIGILLLCFGGEFELKALKGRVIVPNLLNVKEIGDEAEVQNFAYHLINLQHYRNPYIHPEISEMEKLSLLRDTALQCLRYIMRLSG